MVKPLKNNSANQFLLFSVLLVIVLYYGREFLTPIVFAAFFAMLMAPVCRWLELKNIKRPFSTIICVFILLIFLLGIFAIIVGQITSLTDDLPLIQKKMEAMLGNLEHFVQQNFNIEPPKQVEVIKHQIASAGQSAGSYFGKIISGVTGTLGGLVLIVVYTFLLLFHKEKYETFFLKAFSHEEPHRVKEVLEEITQVGQKYISGRAITIVFLWIIYSVALLILGVKDAILLSAIAALLSVIPYIGTILGSIFPFLMAVITKDLTSALWVVAVLIFLHALSTYFIEPVVIGRKVKLSAMAMIVSIIAGGLLWGVSGMILFIPILAMVKILFENVDDLKHYAYLIGDPEEGAKPNKIEAWISKKFTHKKEPA